MRTFARLASAVVLSAGLAVGACSQGADTGDRVEKALEEAKVENVNVDYDRDSRVVHLKGKVDTTYDKERANQIANSIVGTSGKVVDELTVEGMNAETADNLDGQIKSQLEDAVKNDATLADHDIDFDVNNGVVTISGEVPNARTKERVQQIAKGTTGVKDVANELKIDADKRSNEKRGTSGRTQDPDARR
jgi:hyperosmotically inducible protein